MDPIPNIPPHRRPTKVREDEPSGYDSPPGAFLAIVESDARRLGESSIELVAVSAGTVNGHLVTGNPPPALEDSEVASGQVAAVSPAETLSEPNDRVPIDGAPHGSPEIGKSSDSRALRAGSMLQIAALPFDGSGDGDHPPSIRLLLEPVRSGNSKSASSHAELAGVSNTADFTGSLTETSDEPTRISEHQTIRGSAASHQSALTPSTEQYSTVAGTPATGEISTLRDNAAPASGGLLGGLLDHGVQLSESALESTSRFGLPDVTGNHAANRAVQPYAHPTLPAGVTHLLADVAARFPDRAIEVLLSPEELGRVRMTMTTHDGSLTMLIQAERPDTLDLLRRNIAMLTQDFHDLGFRDVTFEFDQRHDTHRQPQDATRDQPDPPSELAARQAEAEPVETSRLRLVDGLDLRL